MFFFLNLQLLMAAGLFFYIITDSKQMISIIVLAPLKVNRFDTETLAGGLGEFAGVNIFLGIMQRFN
jgi:hypothetical protein